VVAEIRECNLVSNIGPQLLERLMHFSFSDVWVSTALLDDKAA
jgi:hypothetical protein